jgi:hypothetical protein
VVLPAPSPPCNLKGRASKAAAGSPPSRRPFLLGLTLGALLLVGSAAASAQSEYEALMTKAAALDAAQQERPYSLFVLRRWILGYAPVGVTGLTAPWGGK